MSSATEMPLGMGVDIAEALAAQGKKGRDSRKAAKIETPVVETTEVATDTETEKAAVAVEKGRVARFAEASLAAVKEFNLYRLVFLFALFVAMSLWCSHSMVKTCRGEVERQNAELLPYLQPADLAAARELAFPSWWDPRHYVGTPDVRTGLVTTLRKDGQVIAHSYEGKWRAGEEAKSLPRI